VRPRGFAPATLVALFVILSVGSASAATVASVPTVGTGRTRAHVASLPAHAPVTARTAPSGPPLSTGEAGSGAEEESGGTPQAEGDPLVSNGLGSPTCKGVFASELSPAGRRNCETSGFVAAPAPSGDYGIDVHIDTGVLGVSSDEAVQDLIVTPLWTALVWAVHALVVIAVKLSL
jgi:hypothetical protein